MTTTQPKKERISQATARELEEEVKQMEKQLEVYSFDNKRLYDLNLTHKINNKSLEDRLLNVMKSETELRIENSELKRSVYSLADSYKCLKKLKNVIKARPHLIKKARPHLVKKTRHTVKVENL